MASVVRDRPMWIRELEIAAPRQHRISSPFTGLRRIHPDCCAGLPLSSRDGDIARLEHMIADPDLVVDHALLQGMFAKLVP